MHPPIDMHWSLALAERYTSLHDITYATANNTALKLDVYKPQIPRNRPQPTLLYFHGGGWMNGYPKHVGMFHLLPFLQIGWTVVNADYRSSSVSLAPAAVEDCLCALRWVWRNAREHNIDTTQVVLMGHSAGGHLALMTGMIPLAATGLSAPSELDDMYDRTTGARLAAPLLRAAAIINWYGITDVLDLIEGPNLQPYAVRWLGNQSDRAKLAKLVSPLTHVQPCLPPIITVHGTRDLIVPYQHAVHLHQALTAAGSTNRLITLEGAEHGNFDAALLRDVYAQLFEFLEEAGLTLQPE